MGSNRDIKPITPAEARKKYEEKRPDLSPAIAHLNQILCEGPITRGGKYVSWSALPLNLSCEDENRILLVFKQAGWMVSRFDDQKECDSGLVFYPKGRHK